MEDRLQSETFTFSSDISDAMFNIASANNLTLKHVACTSYIIFLFKLTGKRDFSILQNQCTSNTAKKVSDRILYRLDPSVSFSALFDRITKTLIHPTEHASFDHQSTLNSSVFLDMIFKPRTLTINTKLNSTIKNSISFNVHSIDIDTDTNQILSHLSVRIKHDSYANTLNCTFSSSFELLNETTIEILANRFHTLCHQLFSSTFDIQTQSIYELSILLPNEQKILEKLNNNTNPSKITTCIHQAFVQQAIQYPNKIALFADDQSLTYGELLFQLQQLSLILINEKGIKSGDNICQYIDRSIEMIIGVMSIIMVGGIYIPLSPTDPFERLQSLVRQVKPKLILVNEKSRLGANLLSVPIVNISSRYVNESIQVEQLSQVNVTPESISYIVFTSGSTGVPKGVQIRHRNLMAYIKTYIVQTNDIVLQLTASSFDTHLEEIFGPLIRGAQLVILKPANHLDFDYVTQTVFEKEVTYIGPVPSWFNALGKYLHENHHTQQRIKSLRYCFLLGEALHNSILIQILPFVDEQCQFLHDYGPAEITFAATRYIICREEILTLSTLPIGYPLMGYQIYLLDEYHQLVIPGQIGEIFIGGVGVFAGYYDRDDLTSQVLIRIDNELCYASGDLARLDIESGKLIFVGRRDFQIKLRGQRIELSAIESIVMESSSNIMNCIITKENIDDDEDLVAYIQTKTSIDKGKSREELFNKCKSQLPSYMIPTKWIFALEFPLNINGKVDRKKLKEIKEDIKVTSSNDQMEILSALELKLQDIFLRAFRLPSLPDIRTSFGLLGGTSLGVMRALNLIREEITEKIDIGLLFTNSSVESLAKVLKPITEISESNNEKEEIDDEDFSIRLRPSWIIESIGILILVWQWLWPILLAIQLEFCFLSMLFVPLIHLIEFPLFIQLLGVSFAPERKRIYSWNYYRLWFLKRQWSLNTYWLGYLLGTPFYNTYLRLCGARIHHTAHIYTTRIDTPWLVKIGDTTYIADDVVLSSLTYHDRTYEIHAIHVGSHCSIGCRSVLHDGVNILDGVFIEPLSNVTGRINGNYQQDSSVSKLNYTQSIFQLGAIFTVIIIQICILKVSWFLTNPLCLCLQLSIAWLIWILLCSAIALVLLSCIGQTEENFSFPLNSWQFIFQFWLRKLILNSFGSCLASVFDQGSSFIPPILQWLGARIDNKDIFVVDITPLLAVPSNLLIIDGGITIACAVCFVPFDVTVDGRCIVTGHIRIGHRSFIGNSSVIRSGACILEGMHIGALTRVDSTISNVNKGTLSNSILMTLTYLGDFLLGIPAQSISVSLTITSNKALVNNFQALSNELINIFLFSLCITLTITMTSNLNLFPLSVLIFLFIYSTIISAAHRYLLNGPFSDEAQSDFHRVLAMFLVQYYERWFGSLLAGTQWLVVILRQLGAKIGVDVIIDDMICVEDIHLTTIGSHVRVSSTSRIQCHTFEQRSTKYHPVTIGPSCILKPMSLVLPGVTMMGHNHIMPCSVLLPHDRLPAHTDWSGSPVKQLIVRHDLEQSQFILAEHQSCLGSYDVVVGRYHDDVLTLYFRDNKRFMWQTRLDLRRPFRLFDMSIKLSFTGFLCKPETNHVLIFGLGGGILPILINSTLFSINCY